MHIEEPLRSYQPVGLRSGVGMQMPAVAMRLMVRFVAWSPHAW